MDNYLKEKNCVLNQYLVVLLDNQIVGNDVMLLAIDVYRMIKQLKNYKPIYTSKKYSELLDLDISMMRRIVDQCIDCTLQDYEARSRTASVAYSVSNLLTDLECEQNEAN